MALPKFKAAEKARLRAMGRKEAARALGFAPVQPARADLPLWFGDRAAATLQVTTEPIFAASPAWHGRAVGPLPSETAVRGNFINDAAAMRALLLDAHESGGNAARVSVLLADGRSFILEGSWAAIRRALPDRATIEAWRAAGVTEIPRWDFAVTDDWHPDGYHHVRWVPIDEAPRVVQVEYESRGFAYDRWLAAMTQDTNPDSAQ